MTVYERTYNTDTMKRMLDFMYYGEYNVHADNTATKMDVLSHLFVTRLVRITWQKV